MSRVHLRFLSVEDNSAVLDLLQNPRVMKHIGPRRALTTAESEDWFANEICNPSRFVVACSETNELMGFCGIKNIDGLLDFGYFFREKFWNKGYATEACEMALLNLAENLDLSTIQIFIAENNNASICVAKKLNWSKLVEIEKDGELGCLYAIHL